MVRKTIGQQLREIDLRAEGRLESPSAEHVAERLYAVGITDPLNVFPFGKEQMRVPQDAEITGIHIEDFDTLKVGSTSMMECVCVHDYVRSDGSVGQSRVPVSYEQRKLPRAS